MTNRSDLWFCGPGHYFWTSDTRLADLELGHCASREELAKAIRNMVQAGREEMEWGGSAYRVHSAKKSPAGKLSHPATKSQRRQPNGWNAPGLSA